jgi:hypothetical protein
MKISKHLTLKEVTKSNTADRKGIDNTPTAKHLKNLRLIAEKVFEPLRNNFGVSIGISSGYRSKALNDAINGSSTSQHMEGQALDIDADMYGKITNKQIFEYILQNCEFTQLIWEYGTEEEPNWVHVGYDPKNLKNQVLKVTKSGGYRNML